MHLKVNKKVMVGGMLLAMLCPGFLVFASPSQTLRPVAGLEESDPSIQRAFLSQLGVFAQSTGLEEGLEVELIGDLQGGSIVDLTFSHAGDAYWAVQRSPLATFSSGFWTRFHPTPDHAFLSADMLHSVGQRRMAIGPDISNVAVPRWNGETFRTRISFYEPYGALNEVVWDMAHPGYDFVDALMSFGNTGKWLLAVVREVQGAESTTNYQFWLYDTQSQESYGPWFYALESDFEITKAAFWRGPRGRMSQLVFADTEGRIHLGHVYEPVQHAREWKFTVFSVGAAESITALGFHPSGRSLAVGVDDGIRLLNMPSGNKSIAVTKKQFIGQSGLKTHSAWRPTAVAFNANGRKLAVGDNHGLIWGWDVSAWVPEQKEQPSQAWGWLWSLVGGLEEQPVGISYSSLTLKEKKLEVRLLDRETLLERSETFARMVNRQALNTAVITASGLRSIYDTPSRFDDQLSYAVWDVAQNEPIAMAIATPSQSGRYPLKPVLYLESFSVAEGWEGSGVAPWLLHHILSNAYHRLGMETVHFVTREKPDLAKPASSAAIPFYRDKLGAQVIGRHEVDTPFLWFPGIQFKHPFLEFELKLPDALSTIEQHFDGKVGMSVGLEERGLGVFIEQVREDMRLLGFGQGRDNGAQFSIDYDDGERWNDWVRAGGRWRLHLHVFEAGGNMANGLLVEPLIDTQGRFLGIHPEILIEPAMPEGPLTFWYLSWDRLGFDSADKDQMKTAIEQRIRENWTEEMNGPALWPALQEARVDRLLDVDYLYEAESPNFVGLYDQMGPVASGGMTLDLRWPMHRTGYNVISRRIDVEPWRSYSAVLDPFVPRHRLYGNPLPPGYGNLQQGDILIAVMNGIPGYYRIASVRKQHGPPGILILQDLYDKDRWLSIKEGQWVPGIDRVIARGGLEEVPRYGVSRISWQAEKERSSSL